MLGRFTIKDIYRRYAQGQDPAKLFEKASNWITTLQTTALDGIQQECVSQEIQETTLRAIYGSNMIERAGLGWEITASLCRKVFAGEDTDEVSLEDLYHQQPDLRELPPQNVLRGRKEIVQHAKAFQYLIHAFIVENQDLTEDLIKATHKILSEGIPIIEPDMPDAPAEKYGGIYRTVIVGAGTTNFTVPSFVPSKMKDMCDSLVQELATAGKENAIDPFSIAAKYSLEFVSIHPFQDGNGRVCRMILNAILCRYAGIIVPIGEQAEDREEYMGIKRRASQEMEGHGEYATFVLQKAVTRLREMKKKVAGKAKTGKVAKDAIDSN
ncbi:Filamentation induced protein by cAMP/death on curing [Ilyonectria sp. MPI-CAGE-AT-0026]|nr:Filamentation induced protein by cAMP/death on curing [Ilyonectria sp. MPI-CAGE-AT-0026]